MALTAAERRIVWLMGAVQLVNVLDFMMVMPLGPDFATALAIPAGHIGFIAGAYTAAACVSGLAGAFYLDRFDRRAALAVALLGLVIATAAGALAFDLASLIATRVAAGLCGGPAFALAIAIVTDAVAVERRGRALGMMMGAFPVASVLGVPAGLELSQLASWRAPFLAVAATGLIVGVLALRLLAPQRGHLQAVLSDGGTAGALRRVAALVSRPGAGLAYLLVALTMVQGFMIIPNIAAWLQFNLGFPRAWLGTLYMAGGALSFFVMRYAGRLTDRHGATPVAAATTLALAVITYLGFIDYWEAIPIIVLFAAYMVSSSARHVANGAVMTKVPPPQERARFMAVASAVQHAAGAGGAILAAGLLETAPDGKLIHMPLTATVSIAIGLAVPLVMAGLERRLRHRPVPGVNPDTVPLAQPPDRAASRS